MGSGLSARRGRKWAVRALLVLGLAGGAPLSLAALGGPAPKLPPQTLRGPAQRLNQYPTLSLATSAERTAAERLLADMRSAARPWRAPRGARGAGFDTDVQRRRVGDRAVHYLHAEHRRYSADRVFLDPSRPETLVYANAPGRPLVLIGVMFSMPRGVHGPTPGGPITRWHTHRVCVRGTRRGLTPRPDGTCPPGSKSRQGSEMLHVWFTRDLRSAFAIHAPAPELCVARLLPAGHCGHKAHHRR